MSLLGVYVKKPQKHYYKEVSITNEHEAPDNLDRLHNSCNLHKKLKQITKFSKTNPNSFQEDLDDYAASCTTEIWKNCKKKSRTLYYM